MGTNEVSTDEVITELTKIYGDTFDRTVRHTSLNPRREGIIAVLVHLQSTRRLMADEVADIITVANAALQYGDSTLGEAAHRILSQFPITGTVNPTTEPDDTDTEQRSEPESFEFLNELALAFRRGEKNARPQHTPVLEGIRAVLAHLTAAGRLIPAGGMALTAEQVEDVRIVLGLNGSQDIKVVLDAQARLRALFSATEPAEETASSVAECFECVREGHPLGNAIAHVHHHDMEAHAASFNEGYDEAVRQFTNPVDGIRNFPRCGHYLDEARCTRREHEGDHESTQGDEVIVWPAGEPDPEPAEDGWDGVNPNDPQGRTYRVTAEEYYSVPAETAEEPALCRDPECGACNAAEHPTTAEPGVEQMKAEQCAVRLCVLPARHSGVHADREGLRWNNPTSSPVVPAPTETEWQTLDAVPTDVRKVRDGLGELWKRDDLGRWLAYTADQRAYVMVALPVSSFDEFAPFVAAEENS